MDESKFWATIELIYHIPETIRRGYDFDVLQKHLIKKHLKQHSIKDILCFQEIFAEKVYELFLPKIADLVLLTAYPFKDRDPEFKDISNDGFLDFRFWIVSLGKYHFDIFLDFKEEEEVLPFNLHPENAYSPSLGFIVDEIYEELNPENDKKALDYCDEYGISYGFDGDYKKLYAQMNWNTLEDVYPKLFKKYQSRFNK